MAARRMAGGADREGSVFFFLKKKEAKKTLFFGFAIVKLNALVRQDGLLRFARNGGEGPGAKS
jgi:hypothetical protein